MLSTQQIHPAPAERYHQLRPAKPLSPSSYLNPQPLPSVFPAPPSMRLPDTNHQSPHQSSHIDVKPSNNPNARLTSITVSTDSPLQRSSRDKPLRDRRVNRSITASSTAPRPTSTETSGLGDRITRREHAHRHAISQKRLRGASSVGSNSTSSLTELALQPSVADDLPSPEQIDLMARTHRRRASESNGYYAHHRTKRTHAEHIIQQNALPPHPVKTPLTLSNFRLSKVLGSGGTATVVKAEPIAGTQAAANIPAKEVALKAISKKGLSRRAQHYLAREIAIHRNVQKHPHIASLYDVFEDSSGIYLVMELLRGSDLYGVLKKEKRGLCEKYALTIIAQLLDALRHMHAMGCAHRDIKPENLMFTERPNLSEGRLTPVKLIDFGLACARNPNAPEKDRMSSEKCGTVRYAAPEIVTETSYIPELCDIWSVGIVLYSIIAHRNPFTGKTEKEVLQQIQNSDLSFDGVEWENISEDTKNFIRSCLNRKATERPAASLAFDEVHRILNMLSTQVSQSTIQSNESTWETRSSRHTRAHGGQRGGHDFSGFSSNVTAEGSSSQGRREKPNRDEESTSPLRSSSEEGAEHPLNFFDGVRAWFSGSSPDRDGSDSSN